MHEKYCSGKVTKQLFYNFEKMQTEKIRLDKYLWAIRIFKTRTMASSAIEDGKVKMHGTAVKAARAVAIGDRYEIKTPACKWIIEVTALLHNRAGYEVAIQHYVDLTPEEEKIGEKKMAASFYTGKRLSKTGKPTKKERRNREDFFDEES